ncbi:Coenzyme F420 hydrogenase/dehydrogenase, beta subunit C-terminal domain [Desulfospira joergensenii]|uniref:Coenzyme F420 hydrogenase/dehydrogenase, beta subunit C-terminal domain n=1 Tax=Desulfospira joergensenii TaxID=53329 RepID=UPI0003B4DF03|nr:Coenzyme F420 hydrogenase/dehydrogenase, beta subunit C-terminal domain [Desulfospira joergensenii]
MGKTFSDLIREVQEEGKCSHCGGCVTFCSAVNYGALKMDPEGSPVYRDREKCLECGLCYSICPQTSELDREIRQNSKWKEPLGNIIGIAVTRAKEIDIRKNGTDGGVVTAILTYLMDTGRIDGAIVSRNTEQGRVPCLTTTREGILASAGSHFSSSQGMVQFAREYGTFSPSIEALAGLRQAPLDRIAFVGTPCQINTIRKMQALSILPADSIKYCLGLFCSGNFSFTGSLFRALEKKYGFSRENIEKINIKDDFIFSLFSGKTLHIPIDELTPVRRHACNFCDDFSAEYADISFGGLGAENGWTTSIARSSTGKDLFDQAREKVLESYGFQDNPKFITQAEEKIFRMSGQKKERAKEYRSG